ncbi:hypothetical protein [Alicyclobacillus ferrooxydans]|uniref:Uncharacterized protein n=1 Tax=Alicyclobacillus ferrooxydans TaxID=471514 RepID=A0A0P9GN31_9BACL|nr:hypothetical protein [Alicyclobacillus ferrooxydans]KPV41850.1 hypothetical protein AN477_20290 [Alicyclobacillus ferrooxydans]
MSIAVCVFITWCTIVALALIPKKLTSLEMVFLFFVCTIFELSVFNIFNLNLQWMMVSKNVEKSLADLVMRLICIPVALLMASNFILYSSKFLKWGLTAAMVLLGVLMQKTIEWLGILSTPNWNIGYTALLFCSYIVFTGLMTIFITRLKQAEGQLA